MSRRKRCAFSAGGTRNGRASGVTELLRNQMEWIGRMNALREAATEIINAEVIFV